MTSPPEREWFWVLLAVATLIGALFVCVLAFFFYSFQGDTEDGDRLAELLLLVLALAGLIPAFGMLIQSIDRRGHPGRWFAATVIVYSPWLFLLLIGS